MRFEFHCNHQLPTLAWCAAMEPGRDAVVVEHGEGVETGEDYFVEGAWNGAFEDAAFHTSTVLLGSGGKIDGDRVRFCPTSHAKERLYHTRRDDRFLISNSLPFLLEASNDWIDYAEWRYEHLFLSSLQGLDRLRSTVPTRDGLVHLLYCSILTVDSSLNARATPRPGPPRFGSYEDYVGTTRQWIAELAENAGHGSRHRRYSPLATISSGYDSAASSALAEEVGCTEAVNVGTTRPVDGISHDDSGQVIADRLGLSVHRYDREDLRLLQGSPEADFMASGNGGDDLVFSLFEDRLPGRTLFTGFLGDTFWAVASQPPERSLQMQYREPAGSNLNEFRIRVGFIHLPVPLLSFTGHRDVQRISLSDEMQPWRMHNDYDRPIPRRILEEKGIPREAFGTHKGAITVPLSAVADATALLSTPSAQRLRAYTEDLSSSVDPNLPSRLRFWRDSALTQIRGHCSPTTFWRLLKTARVLSGEWQGRNSLWVRYSSLVNCLRFHWAMDEVRPRYAPSALSDL